MALLQRVLLISLAWAQVSTLDITTTSAPTSKSTIFTAVSPKLIRAHSEYSIFVTVEKSSNGIVDEGPPDTITFNAELVGVPEPKPGEDTCPWCPRPVPLIAFNADGEAITVPTTTPKPPPPIPIQNYKSEDITVEAGSSGVIRIAVRQLTCCSQFNMTIKALTNTEQSYTQQGQVFRDTRTRSLLIQTDKPIYKPGDIVRFRVLVLDRNLVPVTNKNNGDDSKIGPKGDKLSIVIKDAQGNVIRDLKDEKAPRGLYSGSLELSTEPNLGDWRITATVSSRNKKKGDDDGDGDDDDDNNDDDDIANNGDDPTSDTRASATHSFNVDQYVLPTFKVDIKTHPKFVTFNNTKVKVQIDAMYTYGKKLDGFAIVSLVEPYSYIYYNYQPNGESTPRGPRTVVKKTPISGTAFVEFDINKEFFESGKLRDIPRYQQDFRFDVSVADTLTGRMVNGTHTVTMYENRYKIELIQPPSNCKPGFPLTLTIKVSTQDDLPVSDPSPDALIIRHGYQCSAQDGVLAFPIPPSGLVTFTVVPPTNELVSGAGLEVVYKDQTQTLYPPQKMMSPSHSYMQVEIMTKTEDPTPVTGAAGVKYAVGQEVKFKVRVNKRCSGGSVDYALYGRGEILAQGKTEVSPGTSSASDDAAPALQEHEFSITSLPPHAAPESTLVAYCVLAETNEVLADSIKIRAVTQFKNNLSLKFTSAKGNDADTSVNVTMEPAEKAALQVESMQQSLVALRGVDQSVLVLKQDNDITAEKIDQEIARFQNQLSSYRIWGGSTAFQIFEEAGLVVLTNGVLERQNWVRPYWPRRNWRGGGGGGGMRFMAKAAPMRMEADNMMMDGAVMPMAAVGSGSSSSGIGQPIRVRQHFPESWLWEEVCMNDSASILQQTTVPDTITSWYISGYSLHPELGIALSGPPVVVQVFRPFFVTLNVPYSVVKGEMLGLQVLVHNYMEENVDADVTLANVDNTLAFNEDVNTDGDNAKKVVQVAAGSVTSVIFAVTPIKFGTIKLSVRGTTQSAGDAIEQPLIVKPPGHKLSRTAALLIDLKSKQSFDGSLVATFPEGREPGADELRASVVGDLLGATLKHLDRLLAMPCGCGEQNMLNFVPDIVILDYLNTTGTLSNGTRARAIRFLEQGYQRELTYKHYDGSFSAFGQSDPQGSTWLTAFVVKSFIQASEYITVDMNTIVQGLQYLVARQHTSGSFIELGHVLHAEMQGGGGPGNELALTSYVLLAFIEAKNCSALNKTRHGINFDIVIQKGVGYILESYPVAKNDSYTVNLITYVLTLLHDERADEFFKDLESLVIKDGDGFHWDSAKKPYPLPLPDIGPESGPFPFIYHPTTRPVAVEMTSYALMTYLVRDDLMTGLDIVKWLLQQRNALGGFISTQDTVVGLTALARFAAATRSVDTDMEVTVSHGEVVEKCNVDASNEIVLQEFRLSTNSTETDVSPSGAALNDTVTVHAEGKGTALAVLTWTYYMEERDQKPAFQLDIKVEPTINNTGISLYICSQFLAGARSNMIVEEVNLPSGYMFAQEDITPLTQKVPKLKRADLENVGTQLQLYYDYLGNNGTDCITLTAARVFKVANPNRAYVHVYDYYDTTLSAVTYYKPPEFSPCDLCDNEVDGGGNCKIQNC